MLRLRCRSGQLTSSAFALWPRRYVALHNRRLLSATCRARTESPSPTPPLATKIAKATASRRKKRKEQAAEGTPAGAEGDRTQAESDGHHTYSSDASPDSTAEAGPSSESRAQDLGHMTGADVDRASSGQQKAGMWTPLRDYFKHSRRTDARETEDVEEVRSTSPESTSASPESTSASPEGTSATSEGTSATPDENEAGPSNKSWSRKKKAGSKPAASKKGSAAKSKGAKKEKGNPVKVKSLLPRTLNLTPVELERSPQVPQLSYNLDRVLFNPGVYHMQDHRSRVFNFDPYLASIMPVNEFDFDALKQYITSSKDVKLRQLCAKHGLKYCGSTSSMTSMLSHFHFLLSAWRQPSFDNLSRLLEPDSLNFTALSRGPAAAFAQFQDGVYAIDADKEYDAENILSMLGKSIEKLLTLPKEEFERYRRTKSHELSEEERNAEESYHYSTLGDFMLRSQLDAHDPRLPGSGMFDLKTRAVISIRMDVRGYEKGVGYEIRKRFGQWESFEREYYDMIRAAFLKYSLQVRMGRMDGIFVAFHNTQRIFGFQYVSLEEMDRAIHGTYDPLVGHQEFKASIVLLNELLNRATERFPGRSLRLHVETRPTKVPLTYFFAEPVTEEEMQRIQEASKPSVEQLRDEIRGLSRKEREAESLEEEEEKNTQAEQQQLEDSDNLPEASPADDPQAENAWTEMITKVEETIENETLGIGTVREAVQDALEKAGLLRDHMELESKKYLDDLVAALITRSSEDKGSHDATAKDDDADGSTQSQDSETVPAKDQAKTESASLTDLILKVTEGIENGKSENLETFQRIFVDLAAQSKRLEAANGDDAPKDDARDGSGIVDDRAALDSAPEDAANKEEVAKEAEDGSGTPLDPESAGAADDTEEADDDAEEYSPLDSAPEEAEREGDAPGDEKRELLGMCISVRNKVNGKYVERPEFQEHTQFDWVIEYAITEIPDGKAHGIYDLIKKRRKKLLLQKPEEKSAEWYRMFKGRLPAVTKLGMKYRKKVTRQDAGNPVQVAWDRNPLPPEVVTSSGR